MNIFMLPILSNRDYVVTREPACFKVSGGCPQCAHPTTFRPQALAGAPETEIPKIPFPHSSTGTLAGAH